jgi:glucose-6-phosphate 1-dehydrogenase
MVKKSRIEDVAVTKYLQTCDIPAESFKVEPFTLVIFGGTGDLSRKKLLPALFHIYLGKELPEHFSILSVGGSKLEDDSYRTLVERALRGSDEVCFSGEKWAEFRTRLFYLSGNLEEEGTYRRLCSRLDQVLVPTREGHKDVIYYMAIPPQTMPTVVNLLNRHGLCRGPLDTKIIVEKPFGRDFSSAVQLNRLLTGAFDERQVYRIDHYLGKETVQNIIFFRFSNSIFEQLWNHRYIDNVQITVAEDIGIDNRVRFYEQAGVIRDIVQNHILQLIGLIAMEPPVGFEADFIRDEKTKVFRSLHPMKEEQVDRFTVIGQYGPGKVQGREVPGYRQEKGVSPGSPTPTFFAGAFYIANWRWAGIPFYVRTGKRLARRVTEIAIQFDQPPLRLFGRTCDVLEPNVLLLTIQPEEKISLRFGVKVPSMPNQIYPIDMKFSYKETFQSAPPPAYERLIQDCLKGDLTLFVRQDQIEAMWEAVDPIISCWENQPPKSFPNYAAGTWGPPEAKQLLEQEGRRWITT